MASLTLLGVFATGCSEDVGATLRPAETATASPRSSPIPTATPAPNAGEAPVTQNGTGTKNTKAFTLAGGDYTIAWKATASSSVGCYHSADLESTDGNVSDDAGSTDITGKKSVSDETQVYGLPGGRYFFDVISGCTWTITISPAT